MYAGKTLFAQLMDCLPWTTFTRLVNRYDGDRYVKSLTCAEQYRVMAFAQLTWRESLRDIEVCLSAQSSKLYHMGFRHKIKRSTLADANERRDWRIHAAFAQRLIAQARALYAGETLAFDLESTAYALDSTTIDLSLSLFPWAPFRTTKAAVKMHTLLDLRGNIPSFIHVSDGKLHDVNVLDLLLPEAGAIYVMDRAYVDFQRLHTLHLAGAFFVTRAKSNLDARRLYSAPVDRTTGLICDQTIALNGFYTRQHYPAHLRRIRFTDPDSGKALVFVTNNFTLPAATICALYKGRWQIGVSGKGHFIQSVQVRPRPKDSSLVAWEAPWRESQAVKPSDSVLSLEYRNVSGCNITVNVDVASLHAIPVAETVDNVRRQQGPSGMSPTRRPSPAGYQRRHDTKDKVSTGEALGVRRRNPVEEADPITVSGKWISRRQGGGSGRSTDDRRATKRAGREGPGLVGFSTVQREAGVR